MTASEAKVRRMTAADLDRVLEIAASLKAAPRWARSAFMAALDPQGTPRRVALVAEGPERYVAGFAVACLVEPQAEVETVAVAVESQRRGVARSLMAALAEEFRREQITEVILEARASNLPALRLYRSLGFSETGRRSRYYVDPQEDAILLNLQMG
jgi:ribosomal-protein-alanine N-acetyltransferase